MVVAGAGALGQARLLVFVLPADAREPPRPREEEPVQEHAVVRVEVVAARQISRGLLRHVRGLVIQGVAFCPVTFVNLPDDFDEILGPRSVPTRLDCDENDFPNRDSPYSPRAKDRGKPRSSGM